MSTKKNPASLGRDSWEIERFSSDDSLPCGIKKAHVAVVSDVEGADWAAARRRDEEAAERDREDAERRRAAAEQQRGREAARRVLGHQGGPGRIHDDTEDQRGAEDDCLGLG